MKNSVIDDNNDAEDNEQYISNWSINELEEENLEENAEDSEHFITNNRNLNTSINNSTLITNLTQNYIQEILDILKKSQEINYKNALEINKEMQGRLLMVRSEIQNLIKRVQNRYDQNEQRLIESLKPKKKSSIWGAFGKISKGENFYIKGNTYFRDMNNRNCPNNQDYFERQRKGEMFPMDFELTCRHIWSIKDKTSIVQGIKEQIIIEKKISSRTVKTTLTLSNLLKLVDKDFQIDWNQISAHNIRYRHSPTSCKAMWDVYMHPSLKHDNFTKTENISLQIAVEKYNNQDWKAIAAEVGDRSDYQCFLQYHTSLYFRKYWGRWNKKDDKLLLETIEASKNNGVINWSQVAYAFPQKSKFALQQRYQYAIHPEISHEPFTGEEDLLLLAAVQEYGTNFAKIPKSLFPNRSIIQMRTRYWNTLHHRHKSVAWTLEDDRLLLKFVEENGCSSWKKCADSLENRHTRISCRQRYMVIQKHFKKDANATLEMLPRRPHRLIHTTVTPQNFLEKVEEFRTNPEALVKKRKPRKRKMSNKNDTTDDQQSLPKKRKQKKDKDTKKNPTDNKGVVIEKNDDAFIFNEIPLITDHSKIYLQLQNFFKYSYNFNFSKDIVKTPYGKNYLIEIRRLKNMLGFQMPDSKSKIISKKVSSDILYKDRIINGIFLPKKRQISLKNFFNKEIKIGKNVEPNGSYMQPNFSTIAAFRAACILTADNERKTAKISQVTQQHKQHIKQTNNQSNDIPESSAINIFRQRLRCLFYNTAVLSRISPSMLKNSNIKNLDDTIGNHAIEYSNISQQENKNRLLNSMSYNDITERHDEYDVVKKENENILNHDGNVVVKETSKSIEIYRGSEQFLISPILEETVNIIHNGYEFVKREQSQNEMEVLRVVLECEKEMPDGLS